MDDLEINDHVEPSVFGDDDPFSVPPPLAPLPPPGEDIGDIQAANGLDDDVVAGGTQVAKKKRPSQPRVKLNEVRLCSPKGISALRNLCSNVQLKGKGHEESDLNKVLEQFEHWAQCLMPKWPFQNVVRQCEKLGPKRSVQNELKRVRRGDDDEVLRGDSGEDEQQEPGTVAGETNTIPGAGQPQQTPEVEQPEERPAPLTEEQLDRIRKNRELAFARREALQRRKMLAEQEGTTEHSEEAENTPTLNDTRNEPSLGNISASQQNDTERTAAVVNSIETDQDAVIENTDEPYVSDNDDNMQIRAAQHHNNMESNGPLTEEPEEQKIPDNNVVSNVVPANESGDVDEFSGEISEAPPSPCVKDGENVIGEMVDTNETEMESGVSNEIILGENNPDQNTDNSDLRSSRDNNIIENAIIIDGVNEIHNDHANDKNSDNLSEKQEITAAQNCLNAEAMDTDFTEES